MFDDHSINTKIIIGNIILYYTSENNNNKLKCYTYGSRVRFKPLFKHLFVRNPKYWNLIKCLYSYIVCRADVEKCQQAFELKLCNSYFRLVTE